MIDVIIAMIKDTTRHSALHLLFAHIVGDPTRLVNVHQMYQNVLSVYVLVIKILVILCIPVHVPLITSDLIWSRLFTLLVR